MANFGRILMGLLTAGLSEAGIAIANAASMTSKSSSSFSNGPLDADDFIKQLQKAAVSQSASNGDASPSYLSHTTPDGMTYSEEGSGLAEWLAGNTGSRLTTAEREANAYNTSERLAAQSFNHNEAVDARLWEQYVAQNKYEWETQSMQNAGINPAMAYGGGSLVPTQATGAMGSSTPARSVSPSHGSIGDLFNSIFTLVRMPMELKSMSAELKSQRLDNELKQKEINWYDKKAGAGIENINADTQTKIKSLEEADSRIANNEMDTELKRMNISESEARTAVEWAKYAQIGLTNELQEQLNPLLVQAQEYENELKSVESEYRERQILAALGEVRGRTAALYAQAALDGARKQGVDIENAINRPNIQFAKGNAQNRANLLRWTAYTNREGLKQAQYQTKNAEYYSNHYEEAFRNSWSQSGVEWGTTQLVGEAFGNMALLGLTLGFL